MLKIKPYKSYSNKILENVVYEKEESPVEVVEGQEHSPVIPSQFTIEHWLDVSDNSIKYKMSLSNEDDTKIIFNFVLPYTVITNSPRFNDQTFWTIKDSTISAIRNTDGIYTVTSDDIVNIYDTSFVDKDVKFSEKNQTIACPLKIFVPSKLSTVNDLILLTYDAQEDNIVTTVEGPAVTGTNVVPVQSGSRVYTQIQSTITAVASSETTLAGEPISLQVQVSDPNISSVYVEQVSGDVNKARILLTNGIGSLIVRTEGMSSGELVRVKFGWQNFSGVAEFNRTLS